MKKVGLFVKVWRTVLDVEVKGRAAEPPGERWKS